MIFHAIYRLVGVSVLAVSLAGCALVQAIDHANAGLDHVRGTVLSVKENKILKLEEYAIRDEDGKEWRFFVDIKSHRDKVKPGTDVRVFFTEKGFQKAGLMEAGHATFLMAVKPPPKKPQKSDSPNSVPQPPVSPPALSDPLAPPISQSSEPPAKSEPAPTESQALPAAPAETVQEQHQ
jgi:hypothetical protein